MPAPGSFIKNVTIDADQPLALARFWAAVLGSDVDEDSTVQRAYVEPAAWGGPGIWFRKAREPRAGDNRLHLDLRALTTMAAEVARVVELGATVVEGWASITTLRDPEGNLFCVEVSPDETRTTG
jgi:predicted enzyme related to lactoylglutathione lyase